MYPLRPAQLRVTPPYEAEGGGLRKTPHFLLVHCPACGESVSSSLQGLVQSLPEVQAFWRAHGRIRALPAATIESKGQAAIVSTFESVAASSRLAIVTARHRFRVLQVHPPLDGRRH